MYRNSTFWLFMYKDTLKREKDLKTLLVGYQVFSVNYPNFTDKQYLLLVE